VDETGCVEHRADGPRPVHGRHAASAGAARP
jgi:hypothetical protein